MKDQKKLLRLRPFNMANFSSGAGYLVFFAMFLSFIFILPASLLVWAGFAIPMKLKDGKIDCQILIMRLNRVLLPICIVLFGIIFFGLAINAVLEGISNLFLAIWISAFPTLGIYFAARLSIDMLDRSITEENTIGRWLMYQLLSAILLIIVGMIGTFLFAALGEILFFAGL